MQNRFWSADFGTKIVAWFTAICLAVFIVTVLMSWPTLMPYLLVLLAGVLIGGWMGGLRPVQIIRERARDSTKAWWKQRDPDLHKAAQVCGLVLFMLMSLYLWASILLASQRHIYYAASWLIPLVLGSLARRTFWRTRQRLNRRITWKLIKAATCYIAAIPVSISLYISWSRFNHAQVLLIGTALMLWALLAYEFVRNSIRKRRERRRWIARMHQDIIR